MGIISNFLSLFSTMLDVTATSIELTNINNEIASSEEYTQSIFLWFLSRKPFAIMDNKSYPQSISYNTGILNVKSYHKNMINKGYFAPTSIEEKLNMLKVAELKNILTNFNINTSGKKAILIQRILEKVPHDFLRNYLPAQLFSISEKGLQFLREYEDCIKLYQHKELNITWHEFCIAHEEGFNFHDTIWKILNQRIIQDKYHSGRREYCLMYKILEEEGKKTEALELLLRILYIDLNNRKQVFIFLDNSIIDAIADHKDFFSMNMIDKLYRNKSTHRKCNKTLFIKIINEIFDKTFNADDFINTINNNNKT